MAAVDAAVNLPCWYSTAMTCEASGIMIPQQGMRNAPIFLVIALSRLFISA